MNIQSLSLTKVMPYSTKFIVKKHLLTELCYQTKNLVGAWF